MKVRRSNRSILCLAPLLIAGAVAPAQSVPPVGAQDVGFRSFKSAKYTEAIPELESAAAIDPQNPSIRIALGESYIAVGQAEKGVAVLDRAIEEQSSDAATLSAVASWLATAKLQLPRAQDYAEMAVHSVEAAVRRLDLDKVDQRVFGHEITLAAAWDALGWVHFQRGSLDEAETFLRAAWVLGQNGNAAEHLSTLLVAHGKKKDAVHVLSQALAIEAGLPDMRGRLAELAGGDNKVQPSIQTARREIAAQRTFKIGKLASGESKAQFFVELAPPPAEARIRMFHGDAILRSVSGDNYKAVRLPNLFPDSSIAKIFLQGQMACSRSGDCSMELLSAPEALRSPWPPANSYRVSGGAVTPPVPTRRVEPEYTERARQARLQGTVVLSVEVDTTGHTRNIRVVRGLGMGLDEQAVACVRLWEFKPGSKDGKPVLVAAAIEVNFRLK